MNIKDMVKDTEISLLYKRNKATMKTLYKQMKKLLYNKLEDAYSMFHFGIESSSVSKCFLKDINNALGAAEYLYRNTDEAKTELITSLGGIIVSLKCIIQYMGKKSEEERDFLFMAHISQWLEYARDMFSELSFS